MKNFIRAKTYGSKVFLGAVALVSSSSSFAAIDLTPAVDVITTDGTAAITLVGMAMLSLAALAVVFKWAKAAIFG